MGEITDRVLTTFEGSKIISVEEAKPETVKRESKHSKQQSKQQSKQPKQFKLKKTAPLPKRKKE